MSQHEAEGPRPHGILSLPREEVSKSNALLTVRVPQPAGLGAPCFDTPPAEMLPCGTGLESPGIVVFRVRSWAPESPFRCAPEGSAL